MKRIVVLLTVAAMMAAMMTTSASPAFAQDEDIFLPPNPIKGQAVSAFTRSLPPSPIKGQLVSQFAKNFGQVT